MASKFQNRLVGTIIIVALGVIVLPGLLDGKKKHYQDEFAAIPLVPKPGDTDETEVSPQANQALPSQPPEGAGAAVEQSNNAPEAESQSAAAPDAPEQSAIAPPKPDVPAPRQEQAKPAVKPESKPPASTAPRPAPVKPAAKPESRPPASTAQTAPAAKPPVAAAKPAAPAPKPGTPAAQQTAEQAPKGQAWVVQLGALKNAAKVSEIVARLRLSGYRVYTVPSQPVAGEITRIFVGPDASRDKLQGALPEMNQLSGLNGQLRAYQVR